MERQGRSKWWYAWILAVAVCAFLVIHGVMVANGVGETPDDRCAANVDVDGQKRLKEFDCADPQALWYVQTTFTDRGAFRPKCPYRTHTIRQDRVNYCLVRREFVVGACYTQDAGEMVDCLADDAYTVTNIVKGSSDRAVCGKPRVFPGYRAYPRLLTFGCAIGDGRVVRLAFATRTTPSSQS